MKHGEEKTTAKKVVNGDNMISNLLVSNLYGIIPLAKRLSYLINEKINNHKNLSEFTNNYEKLLDMVEEVYDCYQQSLKNNQVWFHSVIFLLFRILWMMRLAGLKLCPGHES